MRRSRSRPGKVESEGKVVELFESPKDFSEDELRGIWRGLMSSSMPVIPPPKKKSRKKKSKTPE